MDKIINIGSTEHGGNIFCRIRIESQETRKGASMERLLITGVEGPFRSGNCKGACGQIVMSLKDTIDSITPAEGWTTEGIKEFFEVWDKWHLNDMRAGCKHQTTWKNDKVGVPCSVCGYKYGSAWNYEPLPESVITYLKSLPVSKTIPVWC